MVRGRTAPTLHPDKLIRVRVVPDTALPQYIEIASNVGVSRQHMESRARTTAGQTGISGGDIREMPIPLPPLEEQEQIVAEVERRLSLVDEIQAQVEANLKRAARLRQGILKRAFEGRLVPQDPGDEPAAALLERSLYRDNKKTSLNYQKNSWPRTFRRQLLNRSPFRPSFPADGINGLPGGWEAPRDFSCDSGVAYSRLGAESIAASLWRLIP
jgi:hypothetical protein